MGVLECAACIAAAEAVAAGGRVPGEDIDFVGDDGVLADLGGAVDGRDVEAHAQGLIAGVAVDMGAGAGAGSRVFVRKIPLLVAETNRKGGTEHRGLTPGATSPEAGAVPRVDDQVQHIRFLDARRRSAAGSVIWDADIFNFLLIRYFDFYEIFFDH